MRRALLIVVALGFFATAGLRAGQESRPTQPASQPAADAQRFADLVALVGGPNSASVRLIGASELLRQGWAETPARVVMWLTGSDAAAKTAVATALAGTPDSVREEYVGPLMGMLRDADSTVRGAASGALASYSNRESACERLGMLARDATAPLVARQGAVATLGLMTEREAIGALVGCLGDDAEWNGRVLAALETATGQGFTGAAEARSWWLAMRDVPAEEWQRQQIERLASRNRALSQQIGQLRGQLTKSLRDGYQRTPAAERAGVLISYLGDGDSTVRMLGLELVRSESSDRGNVAEEVMRQVRALTTSPEPRVRSMAIRVVAGWRLSSDGDSFLSMLERETDPEVRRAIINGLGYVGGATAVLPLVNQLRDSDEAVAIEAAGALGRLADRDAIGEVLNGSSLDSTDVYEIVAAALVVRFEATPRESSLLRERLLWAMSRVADPAFATIFEQSLDAREPTGVRQAAIGGIDALSEVDRLEVIVPVTSDPDPALRKAAVDVLARLGFSDEHLEALWSRLSEAREPNAKVRDVAWQGVVRVLSMMPAERVIEWSRRLAEESDVDRRHAVELLQIAEREMAAEATPRSSELGALRVDIGRRLARLERWEEAMATLRKAAEDFNTIDANRASGIAGELVSLALERGMYSAQVSAGLSRMNPPLDGAEIWRMACAQVKRCIESGESMAALEMLASLRANPPAALSATIAAEMDALHDQAASRSGAASPSSKSASQPTSGTGAVPE